MKISEIFKDHSYEIQLKAPVFWFLLVILFFLSLLIMAGDAVSGAPVRELALHSILTVITLVAMISFRRGHYNFSSRIYFSLIYLALGAFLMRTGYEGAHSIPNAAAIMGSFLVISGLFVSGQVIIRLLTVYGAVTFTVITLMGLLSGELFTYQAWQTKQIMYPVIALFTIGFGVNTIRHIFDKVIEQIKKSYSSLESINEMTRELIKSSAHQLNKADTLMENSQETASAVVQIGRNINSISRNITDLDGRLGHTSEVFTELHDNVSHLNSLASRQAEEILHSASSVEEITTSIENVKNVIHTRMEAVTTLNSSASGGAERLHETAQAIGRITNHLDTIRSITEVISNIADQTNLLAMNAAIEAAHAGEAGRGFSVVAGEIRKLAESSAGSASKIADELEELIRAIENANSSVATTGASFHSIEREVSEVIGAMQEMAASANQLSEGAQMVLEGSKNMEATTTEVTENLNQVKTAHDSINADVESVRLISNSITGGMNEINTGIDLINTAVQGINTLSNELKDESCRLDDQVAALHASK